MSATRPRTAGVGGRASGVAHRIADHPSTIGKLR